MRDNDITWILNEECIQVCIGLYQAILVFTHELTMTIECRYSLKSGEKNLELYGDKPVDSSELICLLGHSITQAHWDTNSFLITLSGGFTVRFYLENDGFESLSIIKQSKRIIL